LAANAPFRAKPAHELDHEAIPPNGTGRILPSLIDEDLVGRILQDVLSSKQDTGSTPPATIRRQSKQRRGDAPTSASPRKPKPATEAHALAPEVGAMANASDGGARPDRAAAAPLYSQPVAAAPKVRVKKVTSKVTSVDPDFNQVISPDDGQTAIAELNVNATSPPDIQDSPTHVRRRPVIGRNVGGDEFKPGERWKRLLRWKR